ERQKEVVEGAGRVGREEPQEKDGQAWTEERKKSHHATHRAHGGTGGRVGCDHGGMQAIEGARLIPGARVGDPVAAERLPGPADGKLIRGKALIFWDPKVPGKKLDAI